MVRGTGRGLATGGLRVVDRSTIGPHQGVVGLGQGLEPVVGALISRVQVGMELLGPPPERFADLLGRRVRANAELTVRIVGRAGCHFASMPTPRRAPRLAGQ